MATRAVAQARGDQHAATVSLLRSTVGKKIVMAVTGGVLLLFVIAHMIGNLKIYAGPEKFNGYAHWLREMGAPLLGHGEALWVVRIVLLAAVGLHILCAVQLTLTSWRARDIGYARQERLAFSYASYTMRWGGVVVALFVIYHLLDLTWGVVHRNFIPGSPYHNVVGGFQIWWIASIYILAVITLGLHVYHGIWSAFQTLGINRPGHNAWRRPLAAVVAILLVLGYVSVPIGVMAGVVR